MKNSKLLLTVALLTSTTLAFAQDFVSLGIRGGLNYSTISGDFNPHFYPNSYSLDYTDLDKSPKLNFNLGIDAIHQLNDNMAIQAELFYSREGYKESWTYTYGGPPYVYPSKSSDQYSFLNFPIFFKYAFAKHFYVMGGPQFSYLLAAKNTCTIDWTANGSGGNAIEEETTDVSDQMNKFGMGLVPVVGYDLNKYSIGLRYYAALTQLFKSENNINIKSQVFSVVVSYKVFGVKE